MTPEEKQNQEEQKVSELLKPRYKVIADYPKSEFRIGDILEAFPDPADKWLNLRLQRTHNVEAGMYPHLFQKLEWWMDRAIDDLMKVKFVKVIKYKGYWREGDIVPAEFDLIDFAEVKTNPLGYLLKYNHYQPVFELEPATSDQYTSFINSKI